MSLHRRHRLRLDGRIILAVILALGLVIYIALVLLIRELVTQ